jgi:hypothetical protein
MLSPNKLRQIIRRWTAYFADCSGTRFNHYATVMIAAVCPASRFSRLRQTSRTERGVGVLVDQRALVVIGANIVQ